MRRLLGILVLLLFAGCGGGGKNDESFFILNVSFSCEEGTDDIRVNGEPALAGGAITYFVVEGRNELQLKGGANSARLLLWTGSLFDGDGYDLWSIDDAWIDPDPAKNVITYNFESNLGNVWTWEQSDELGELSAVDKESILQIYHRICDMVQEGDLTFRHMIESAPALPWSADPERLDKTEKIYIGLCENISAQGEPIFEQCSSESLKCRIGKHLVELSTSEENLFYSGPPHNAPRESGKWSYSSQKSEMHFARFNGEWKYLMPTL